MGLGIRKVQFVFLRQAILVYSLKRKHFGLSEGYNLYWKQAFTEWLAVQETAVNIWIIRTRHSQRSFYHLALGIINETLNETYPKL